MALLELHGLFALALKLNIRVPDVLVFEIATRLREPIEAPASDYDALFESSDLTRCSCLLALSWGLDCKQGLPQSNYRVAGRNRKPAQLCFVSQSVDGECSAARDTSACIIPASRRGPQPNLFQSSSHKVANCGDLFGLSYSMYTVKRLVLRRRQGHDLVAEGLEKSSMTIFGSEDSFMP